MHRVLVVGAGGIGKRHIRCFLATGRAQIGIVEVYAQRRDEVAESHALCGAYSTLDAALKESWDAAVIATPANHHIAQARQVAEHGVHLLIEKPLSTTEDGVEELVAEVSRRGLVAAVAYVLRTHPGLTAMRRAILAGAHGQPVQLVVFCGQNYPFYRPDYCDIYYADRARGGGVVQDALTHMLNLGEWLVGPTDRISLDAAHQVLSGVDVEDTVHAMTHHGRCMGFYCVNQYQAPNELVVTVVGDQGTVRFELYENRWRWMKDISGAWHDEPFPQMTADERFTIQANGFLDAMEGKAVPPCSLEEGFHTLKTVLAGLRSAANGSRYEPV